MDWIRTDVEYPRLIKEIPNASPEPIEIYKARYTQPINDNEKVDRYATEIFDKIPEKFSLLVVGSGHPHVMNYMLDRIPSISKMGCVDFIEEAGVGLNKKIDFHKKDILKEAIPSGYDYVFSSHVLEHFMAKQIMGSVIPNMINAADKGVIAVVPYKDAWSGEPSHKCKFNEFDELAAVSTGHKKMLNEMELAIWIGLQ